MAKLRNVTVAADEQVARWARVEAARKGASVSRFWGDILQGAYGRSRALCRSHKTSAEQKALHEIRRTIYLSRKEALIANVFVDTNVILYSVDEADLRKTNDCRNVDEDAVGDSSGRLSFQVLQEFYANFICQWPKQAQAAREDWSPARDRRESFAARLENQDRYKLSFWDGLVLAEAKAGVVFVN